MVDRQMARICSLSSAFAGALAVALAGCPESGPNPTDSGPADECRTNRDCGGGKECRQDSDGIYRCVALVCSSDSDCSEGEHCNVRSGLCIGPVCRPDLPGSCPAGQYCIDGTCQEAPPPADSCRVTPERVVVRAGNTVQLQATGVMNSGAPAPYTQFTWSSGDDSCVTVNDQGEVQGVGSSTCTATVTASVQGGTASCAAQVTNFPAVDLPEVRALVVEEFTGQPVAGATLLVRVDGASAPAEHTATTDENGVATVADVGTTDATAIVDVSVFHDDYTYVTVVRPGTNDLYFALRRVPDPTKMAGAKGVLDFSAVRVEGDIKLGIAGMSIPGALTDLDFMALLGETVNRDINLEGFGNFQDVPLPSGLYMEVANAPIKPDFQAFGEPGTRTLWALGGRVRLADIGPIISEVANNQGGELDVGGIMAAVLPYFSTFYHAVVPNLDLPEVNRPQDGSEPNTWDFGTPEQNVKLDTLLSQAATIEVPTLPHKPGLQSYIEGALVLLGSIVPGQGTVPLGLSAGVDAPGESDPADGVLDPPPCPEDNPNCVGPERGQVIVDFAPPHGGLESTQYVYMAMALSLQAMGEAQFTSVLFQIGDSISPDQPNGFDAGAFLGFPEGGSYTAGQGYAHSGGPIDGADFYRLNLETDNRGWVVYFDDIQRGVTLPDVPDGFEDRSATADLQAIKTFSGNFGVRELFEFNDTNLDDLRDITAAFSTMECVRVEQPQQAQGGECPSGYTVDAATNLCVGGPNEITAFAAGSSPNCPAGYEPVYTAGPGSAGICALTPSCRVP